VANNGDTHELDAPQRVSGMRVPESWSLHKKPGGLSDSADDAWRQTGFFLSEHLNMLETGLDLQVRTAASGYAPSARTMAMAAFASLWSRALLSSADAVALVRRGAYQSAVALIRQTIEHVAAQATLFDEPTSFPNWAAQAYAQNKTLRAEVIGLGHFFGGDIIAQDDQLRPIYRAAGDLGRPNFGPTALFVANEAGPHKYPLIFADEAFHLGWAQLLLDWLLQIEASQLNIVLNTHKLFPAPPELRAEVASYVSSIEIFLLDKDRCRLEEHIDTEGRRHHLITNFRRRPTDAPRRILL
jgi:hypothetical protein